MKVIDRSALLPFSASQLFDLVNDIEAYPQYMDGCVDARVLSREGNTIEAELKLAKGGISQRFSTRNSLQENESITLELVEGPFDSFCGQWRFKALGDEACKVSLRLEFATNNALVGAAAAKLFDRVTGELVDAVSRRAKLLYG
ncbi:type II toxin-antitoxin system RatA family toxin [Parahalioglobus pacificus]|uniref:Ubiquinone-binding protein n=1 Tax=Parahalioglobus pacificus TaxID=930806 RepID=A0A918XLQ4_9GAMM|nr:type II toxin-antitoxin system RatA family toxin [Halioglobus pacificus]NQY03504.1 type II toxin-antitoxin system RatA family toxin [Halieaceae bacterium]GHD38170.1 ubiquinone-binding protein [Halioglobus pacificus]